MAGAQILVVDDAPISLKLIRMVLTHEGYDVRTAGGAEEALAMLSGYRPILVVTDVQLPGMDGLEMTRKIKENPLTSAIRVVALTASNSSEIRDRALSAGCEDYIVKPIDTAALAVKIRDLLARPQAGQKASATLEKTAQRRVGFSGPQVETLRRQFMTEGAARSRELLDSLHDSFDAGRAAALFHQWAGSAALAGHPEIGVLARSGESLLAQAPVDGFKLREVVTNLFLTFTDEQDRKAVPLPEPLLEATTGKRIALIGFTPEKADVMCTVLERLKALPMLFDAAEPFGSPAIRNCDVVVVYLAPETSAGAWMQPQAPALPFKLVFMGAQSDLIALSPELRARATDVLVDREDTDEIWMRLAFALSSGRLAAVNVEPAPVAAAPGAAIRPRSPVGSPTVIVADDDNLIVALTTTMLQNHGMTCRSANNGYDALNLIRSEKPDLAVLDVNMPGMSGFEVLAAVRAENIPSRIIMLTALQQEDEILRGFRLGADDYLTKPFSPFELMARVKRFMQ